MPDEVEIKFLVPDLSALERKLKAAGFHLQTPRTFERNTLYDSQEGRLQKAGELLRLRKYGDRWTLTHKAKGRAGIHKSRRETETGVEDGESMDAILRALGYEPGFHYEKFRSEWTDAQGHVVLDQTPIGDVAEIEGLPDWIDATAQKLAVDPSHYLTTNYAQLFFDWKKRTGSKAKEMTFAEVAGRQP
jgi:adenylate cyclase, class 2